MIDCVKLCQTREVCEELDFLLEKGGADYVTQGFKVDMNKGISEDEVGSRSRKYGTNTFPVRPSKTFMTLVFEALDDLTMQILIVAACISIIINLSFEETPIEGAAILSAVAACTLVAAANDFQKEKQFKQLQKVAEDKKKVSKLILSNSQRL